MNQNLIDSYYCEAKYSDSGQYFTEDKNLNDLKEVVSTHPYLNQSTVKYFVRFTDGQELQINN